MSYNDGGEFGPDDAADAQAAATGTGIGGSEGAPDTGSAIGGDPNFGQAAAANAAAAATEATAGWDFPDPVGGWATSAPVDSTDTTGEDPLGASSPQNPLDSAMAIVDAAIANTGMPAIGTGGLPGMGLQGFGTEMGAMASSLGPVGLDASLQGQATPGAVGGVTGGMLGPAPGGPGQNPGAGQMAGGMVGGQPGPTASDAQAWGDDTGAATSAGVGLSGTTDDPGIPGSGVGGGMWGQGIADVAAQRDEAEYGAAQEQGVGLTGSPVGAAQSGDVGIGGYGDQQAVQGWGADIAAPPAPPNTVDHGLQAALDAPQDSPAPQGTVGTLDSLAQDEATKQQARDEEAAKAEDAMMMARDMAIDKEAFDEAAWDFEDKKGKISSMTPQDKAYAEASRQVNKAGWALFSLITGKNPTEAEKAEIAAANKAADIAQTAMEMDVSTGEDLRAVQNFKAKYPWASKMSDFEVQAYINSPELLKLKLDNMKITEQINNNINLTANDVRALWAPPGAGLPGAGQQSASLYPQG